MSDVDCTCGWGGQHDPDNPRCFLNQPPTYNTVLREYIDLYQHQPARQAELVVPAWALRRLNALTEEQRRNIMIEIDHIAAGHGLLTPTKIIVVPNG